jgi:hypothetical protein
MSNYTTGRIWVLDTLGIITKKPISVRKIVLYPNAAADAALLNWYDTNNPVAAGTLYTKTGTITSTTTLTSSGNLPSTIAVGYVFNITKTSGAAGNMGHRLVTTAGDTNAVVMAASGDALTNEASQVYDWTTYPTHPAAGLLSQATSAVPYQMDFADVGFYIPNLILASISSNAKVYLYLT